MRNTGQDSVIGWRKKWFYVKDTPIDGREFNLAPFVDGKAVLLVSWNNKLTKGERAASSNAASPSQRRQNTPWTRGADRKSVV